jgi:hypothetical protein
MTGAAATTVSGKAAIQGPQRLWIGGSSGLTRTYMKAIDEWEYEGAVFGMATLRTIRMIKTLSSSIPHVQLAFGKVKKGTLSLSTIASP